MTLRTFPRFLIAAFCAATLFASAPDAIAAPTSYTVTSTDGVKLAVQESGLPLGIQAQTRQAGDGLLLQLAAQIERALGGRWNGGQRPRVHVAADADGDAGSSA